MVNPLSLKSASASAFCISYSPTDGLKSPASGWTFPRSNPLPYNLCGATSFALSGTASIFSAGGG